MFKPQPLTDEQVEQLRKEKSELNRKLRRQTGMKTACAGKLKGLLECQTREGKCPEFDVCHA